MLAPIDTNQFLSVFIAVRNVHILSTLRTGFLHTVLFIHKVRREKRRQIWLNLGKSFGHIRCFYEILNFILPINNPTFLLFDFFGLGWGFWVIVSQGVYSPTSAFWQMVSHGLVLWCNVELVVYPVMPSWQALRRWAGQHHWNLFTAAVRVFWSKAVLVFPFLGKTFRLFLLPRTYCSISADPLYISAGPL